MVWGLCGRAGALRGIMARAQIWELTQTATKGWLEAHALMALVLACCGDA